MNDADPDWLRSGSGVSPRRRWSFTTDSPLVGIQLARETGEVLAADSTGGMYLLDRKGRVISVSRGFHDLVEIAWSDNGNGGAAVIGRSRLCRLTHRLEVQWSAELPDEILAIAVSPYGNHVAVSLANGATRVYDSLKRQVGEFDTVRPLSFLRFLASVPGLIGVAEHGLICNFQIDGEEKWSEKMWSNIGDIGVTGDGRRVYLAAYNHGIQMIDGSGANRGSYMVEGTPNHVSTSFVPQRLVVGTLERHLYWLDSDGEILWAASPPDDIRKVLCDPSGGGMICGLASGQIIGLECLSPAPE